MWRSRWATSTRRSPGTGGSSSSTCAAVPDDAWIDLGDQFLALSAGRRQAPDEGRHFGLVVDDKEAVRAPLSQAGVAVAKEGGLRFCDPWGNAVEIVDYRDVQFTKAPAVLRALVPEGLEKSDAARAELERKGLGGG